MLRPLPSQSLAALSTLAIWPTPAADDQTALALQVWVGSARVCNVPQPTVKPMRRDVAGTAHARSSFAPALCCMQGFAVCPNLPFGLCPRLWDEEHMPEADEDDARLYGSDESGSNPGAAWLLVLAGIIGLAALVPSGGNTAAKRSRSCGAAALLGVLVGLYLALHLFPNQHLIQVGIPLHKQLAHCQHWMVQFHSNACKRVPEPSSYSGLDIAAAQALDQVSDCCACFGFDLHDCSLQHRDLPLPVAVFCIVCTASSSLAMAIATVWLLYESAAIAPASSLAHGQKTHRCVLVTCRQ